MSPDFAILITNSFNNKEYAKKKSMNIFTLVPYISASFWKDYRVKMRNRMIEQGEKIIKNLNNYIEFTETATPQTFYNYTLNRAGSIYGWEPSINQIKSSTMPCNTSIKGLFLTGHWTTSGLGQCGIPGVALSGRRTAEKIIRDIKGNWKYKPIFL